MGTICSITIYIAFCFGIWYFLGWWGVAAFVVFSIISAIADEVRMARIRAIREANMRARAKNSNINTEYTYNSREPMGASTVHLHPPEAETVGNDINTEEDISNIYIKVEPETSYSNPEADKYSFSLPSDFPLEQKSVALLFQCFGRFAKDDGRVSEDEAGFIKDRMADWGFCSETQKRLKLEFNEGRDSYSSFNQLFDKFFDSVDYVTLSATEFDKDIVVAFTGLAWGDGLSERKYTLLLYIANAFGQKEFLDAFIEQLRQYEEKNNSSQDNEQANYNEPPKNSLAEYYGILEISESATNAEIKSAWRKKARDFHPDRVRGAGLSEEFVRYANEQLQKINEAYEKICKDRGIT